MLRRLPALAVTATLGLAGLSAPAEAAAAACRPDAGSPRCQVWTGKVSWVADGDTLRVDIAGDGTAELKSVRLIGVQAMEQRVYSPQPSRRRGDCHSLAATARVEQLVKAGGGVVRMTALKASSSSGGRPLRAAAVKINGRWQDIGLDLIRRGHALWLPFSGEWAWDEPYRLAAGSAAHERRGLYDTDACGAGPAPVSGLTVMVNSDPDGVDAQNLNGEWFRIGNPSARAVAVGGWWVRDSGLRRYTLPAGTVVPARGAVYVHVGKGRDTATDKFWGLTAPIFTNVDPAGHGFGDGGYLFDPQGDLRAWMIYPCLVGCGSPLRGTVELRVQYRDTERVELVNTGTAPVDLLGHMVVSKPYSYLFRDSTVLAPGQAREVTLGSGRVLDDAGDRVALQTADQWTVDCVAWGTGRC